jgi:DNA-binding NarL/FixJ family response regulator
VRPLLSPRQEEVLRCKARGLTPHQVAAELRISKRTVDYHTQDAFRRLDVHSLVAALVKAGIIEVGKA